MAQRIVLSREQVRKLRQLRGEADMVPDGDVPNTDAKLEIRAAGIEDTRPHEALTSSITNRIRRPWGFER